VEGAGVNALTASQQAVVESDEPRIYVVAGPGSGKTHTLISRIRHRVSAGVDPERMALVTFTNAGADEMRARLGAIQPGFVGTLHAFVIRLLHKHGHLLGYRSDSGVEVITEEESDELLKECATRLGYKKSVTALRKELAVEQPGTGGLVWLEYWHTLKRNNLVDYDTILREGAKLAGKLTAKDLGLDELLVDECQDSGKSDWQIYDALAIPRKTFFGDPDQSIFGFRGAAPGEFIEKASYADAAFYLQESFRCSLSVADRANALIQRNEARLPKVIIPKASDSGRAGVHHFETEPEEFDFLCGQIKNPREFAILAPTNDLVGRACMAIRLRGLPVAERRPAAAHKLSAQTWMFLQHAANPSSEYRQRKVAAVIRPIPFPTDYPELLNWMTLHGADSHEIAVIREHIARLPGGDLSDLVHDLRESCNEEAKSTPGVTVCTIHAAKGREFDQVAVIGLEEGLLPRANHDIEEARRLLFVAMTRARHDLFLCTSEKRRPQYGTGQNPPSRFLHEIYE
jgi:DNA helicase-2/ATP-dependent DNA helicase PcrA